MKKTSCKKLFLSRLIKNWKTSKENNKCLFFLQKQKLPKVSVISLRLLRTLQQWWKALKKPNLLKNTKVLNNSRANKNIIILEASATQINCKKYLKIHNSWTQIKYNLERSENKVKRKRSLFRKIRNQIH